MAEPIDPEFRVGQVLSRSFGIFGRNLASFSLVALLLMAPSLVLNLAGQSWAEERSQQAVFELTGGFIAFAVLGVVVYLFGWLLITAALVYGTFQELRGRHASMIAGLSHGLALMLPVIGVAIVQGLSIMLGWLLFLIPGIIVAMVLWVAIPVAVVERAGVIGSIKRSSFLTKGHRWKLFGISALIIIGQSIVTTIFQTIIGADLISSWLANWVIGAASAAIWAVIGSVAYHDLRAVKEGVNASEIAKIFD